MEIITHRAASGGRGRAASMQSLARALRGPAARVELDVFLIADHLVIAHDRAEASLAGQLTLAQALPAITAAGRDLLADLKGDGGASALDAALAESGLAGRAIVCGELEQVEQACLASRATRAWTLPTGRRPRVGAHPKPVRAPAGPLGLATPRARRHLERAVVDGLEAGRCDAVCVEHRFVGPSLVRAVHQAGGRLLAWTVDDRSEARRLAGLGVDGLITNQPDALAASTSTGSAQWSDG